jgi:fatty-acid desaturase
MAGVSAIDWLPAKRNHYFALFTRFFHQFGEIVASIVSRTVEKMPVPPGTHCMFRHRAKYWKKQLDLREGLQSDWSSETPSNSWIKVLRVSGLDESKCPFEISVDF